MINIYEIIEHSNRRFQEEIEKAKKSKKIDKARIERRKNETYFIRLVRASLSANNSIKISDKGQALVVAIPEILFSKMLALGWNQTRKQKEISNPPYLLSQYFKSFNSEYRLLNIKELYEETSNIVFNKTLLAHGLSPTSDTILLLADIGRTLRISYSLEIFDVNILLADINWIKYNRSIKQFFKDNEFVDNLRVCLDKRKRLYRVLNLKYQTFGISDFSTNITDLNKSEMITHAKNFREIAEYFWGKKSLEPHKEDFIKRVIGTPLDKLSKKDYKYLPWYIKKIIQFKEKKIARSIEDNLRSEFNILRTISELFSTFDEEIFIYYFAQHFAQQHFSNFLKIAPLSEVKFDQPFIKYADDFNKITNNITKEKTDNSGYIYLPQYKLGSYFILPYTSISGDVVKKGSIDEFISNTILINDSYDNKIDKIIGVITSTETHHRNRLLSDILSFIHILFNNIDDKLKESILSLLEELSEQIFIQISSKQDTPENYSNIFSDWIKSISNKEAVVPFHIIPYTWEEKDWSSDRIKLVSKLIIKLLELVNEIIV